MRPESPAKTRTKNQKAQSPKKTEKARTVRTLVWRESSVTCELQRVLHFVKVVTKAWSVVMILGRYFCEWTYFYVAVPFMRPDPVSTWGFSALTLSWKDNAAFRPFLSLDRLAAVNRRRGISSHFCFYLTNSDPSSTSLSLPISGKRAARFSVKRCPSSGEGATKILGEITPPL